MLSDKLSIASLLGLLTVLCVCSGAYAEDIIIDIGSGSGDAGSQNRPVRLMLDNAAESVKGMQIFICDEGNYLAATSCFTTGRASNFFCTLNECKLDASSISPCRKYPGCANIVLYSAGDIIAAGRGPVAVINYDISESAPSGCVTLNPQKAVVSDQNRNPLSVMAEQGQFCISGGSSEDTTTTARTATTTGPSNPGAESPADSAASAGSASGEIDPSASAQSGFRTPLGGASGVSQKTSADDDALSDGESTSRNQSAGSGRGSAAAEAKGGFLRTTGAQSGTDSEQPHLIISPSRSVINSKGILALDVQTIANGRKIPGKYKWEIVPPSTIGSTIDVEGIFTAGINTSSSPVRETIRATDISNKSISATATITIEGTPEALEGCTLLVTPSSAEIAPGNMITFKAAKLGNSCGEGSYHWKVSSKIGSTITAAGVYTAGSNRGNAAALDIVLVKDGSDDLSVDALVTVVPGDAFKQLAGAPNPLAVEEEPNTNGSTLLFGTLIAVAACVTLAGVLLVRRKR